MMNSDKMEKALDALLTRSNENAKKATSIAMRVFKDVYGFSDNFSLCIEEN